MSGKSEHADGQDSEGCHGASCGVGADLAGVFLVGGVADPVEFVFDAPVTAQ